jgi:hypothetical protein
MNVYAAEAAGFDFAAFEGAETAVGIDDTMFRYAQSHGPIEWTIEYSTEATIDRWIAAVGARPHTRATLLSRERARLGGREGWKATFDIIEEENGPARLTGWSVPHRDQFVLAVVRRPVDFGAEEETLLTESFRWR